MTGATFDRQETLIKVLICLFGTGIGSSSFFITRGII